MIEEPGVDGVLSIGTYEGADPPPGSNLFPQHSRPDHQDAAAGLSSAVREANERSRGERL
ncbi:hypothetical protein HY68_10160 [Streptomyces sp. AcH 505]|nr:hypothetical protein HY68_10160 [Streptomyces sp. AcH 505]